jgi:ABC-type dipeptide/oligopeptide/nickel transport system permease subunit
MTLTTISRSFLARILAALLVVLVVSPYSEPFATMVGTDFGGAGAIDVGGTSKVKSLDQDSLVAAPVVIVFLAVVLTMERPNTPSVRLDSRATQRAILRL